MSERVTLVPPANRTELVVRLNGDSEQAYRALVDTRFIKITFDKLDADPPIPANELAGGIAQRLVNSTAWGNDTETGFMAMLALCLLHQAVKRTEWGAFKRRATQGGWTIELDLKGVPEEGRKCGIDISMRRLIDLEQCPVGHA
jgi:hypothetical protein